jgi:hypothetical protein
MDQFHCPGPGLPILLCQLFSLVFGKKLSQAFRWIVLAFLAIMAVMAGLVPLDWGRCFSTWFM